MTTDLLAGGQSAPLGPRPPASQAFLDVRDLHIHFPTGDGLVKAVDGLSFAVDRGQTLGIVGESGSGKSVTSLGILGLHRRGHARVSGEVWLDGEELLAADAEHVRHLRGQKMAMIFQDPLTSMHPYFWGRLGSMPRVDRDVRERLIPIKGSPPSLIRLPSGCAFYPRCPHEGRNGIPCRTVVPTLAEGSDHGVACHIPPTDRQRIFAEDIA